MNGASVGLLLQGYLATEPVILGNAATDAEIASSGKAVSCRQQSRQISSLYYIWIRPNKTKYYDLLRFRQCSAERNRCSVTTSVLLHSAKCTLLRVRQNGRPLIRQYTDPLSRQPSIMGMHTCLNLLSFRYRDATEVPRRSVPGSSSCQWLCNFGSFEQGNSACNVTGRDRSLYSGNGYPLRSEVLSGAREVRPGTIHRGKQEQSTPLHVLPVWRRTEDLHR